MFRVRAGLAPVVHEDGATDHGGFMSTLRAHEWRWKSGGGYYTTNVAELEHDPRLPDLRKRRDHAFAALFDRLLPRTGRPAVLELGCGASQWLPYLAIRKDCRVTGLDYEPSGAELTAANLRGAGAAGTILCRDAFDVAANADLAASFDLVYSNGLIEHFEDVVPRLRAIMRLVRPGGAIFTTVPNLQGLNWLLQRYGDLRILETHVVYDVERLRRRHEEAGFETVEAGYTGFYDGYMSATAPSTPSRRRRIHQALCRTTNLAAHAWLALTRGHLAPELAWLAPAVYYVGRRPAPAL